VKEKEDLVIRILTVLFKIALVVAIVLPFIAAAIPTKGHWELKIQLLLVEICAIAYVAISIGIVNMASKAGDIRRMEDDPSWHIDD